MTGSDRRLVAALIAALGGISIIGAIGLSGLVLWRLDGGSDMPPGVVSFLIALLGIGGTAGGLLAPSPLSKSSGADTQDVNVVNEPLLTEEAGRVDPMLLVLVFIAACIAAITWHYLGIDLNQ